MIDLPDPKFILNLYKLGVVARDWVFQLAKKKIVVGRR